MQNAKWFNRVHFHYFEGKKTQVVWLHHEKMNAPSISVRYFKLTLTIKRAPQQVKKAKQKYIQAVNTELPYVLENWGSSRR